MLRKRLLPLLLAAMPLASGCALHRPSEVANSAATPRASALAGPALKEQRLEAALQGFEFAGGRATIRGRFGFQAGSVGAAPHGPQAVRLKAEADGWRRGGRSYLALETYAAMARAAPGSPEAYIGLAWALRRVKKELEAEAALRTALDLDPSSREAQADLAALLAAQQRRREAIDLYRELLVAFPDDGEIHARLATQLYYAGDLESALRHVASAESHGGAGSIPDALPRLLQASSGTNPRSDDPALRRATLGAEVRVDVGGSAQAIETAIAGVDANLVTAWNDQRAGQVSGSWRLGVATSVDGGASWSEQLLRPPGGEATDFEGDPTVAYDPRTGSFWAGGVSFFQGGSLYVARKPPGQAFAPPVVVADQDGLLFDKALLAVGPAPGNPSSTRLYIAYREGFHASADLGATWSPRLPLTPTEVYYQPRVAPDGTVYVLSWSMDDLAIRLRRSLNGGASFEPRQQILTRLDVWGLQSASRVPGEARVPPLPVLAIGPSGELYVLFCDTTGIDATGDANLDLYLSRSADGGATWSTPAVIHGPSGALGDQFAPWLEVDAQGDLHAVFYDTRYLDQRDTDPFAWVDVTYAFSANGGASWSETRVTERSSSTEDALWIAGPNQPDYQFLGDYLGLTADARGEAVVSYGAASGGDFDIYTRRVVPSRAEILSDDFESGTLGAWSSAIGDSP
ncbi:MAG: tetratricopeptide repeat protein [Acidobacteriota bacterium]